MLEIINPATRQSIRNLHEDTPETIQEKYLYARLAQKDWAQTPMDHRRRTLSRFADLLEERTSELASTLTQEMGKPITQAIAEISSTPRRIRFFVDQVKRATANRDYPDGTVTYEPLGVIGNISAWNFPYYVGANVFVPALLTGNSVLYKASEFATLSGLTINELLREAGVPESVFTPIIGGGAAGEALIDLPLNGLFFTGSHQTGLEISRRAGGKLLHLQLELGGKDPVYVCDDADLKQALPSLADGAFYNAGQSCCSVERIYVHESLYEPFLQGFVEEVEKFIVGDPMDPDTYLGPLCRKAQIPFLTELVKDAQRQGAQCLTGGVPLESQAGFYFAPTLLADCQPGMRVMQEEAFGPIVGIQRVKTDEEAIALMNDTPFGLTAAVYTKSRKRAREVLTQVESGTAYWNACERVMPELPWGGRKGSGIGCTGGWDGIRCFTQPRSWHLPNPIIP